MTRSTIVMHGVLAVWSDITPEAAADYDAWYEREHMLERLAVDGFHRARHYRTLTGPEQFFTYFVTDDARVTRSPAYLASADNPSPWTQRILPHFRHTNRTAFDVVRRIGWGFGAAALTVRLAAAPEREEALVRWLGEARFPDLLERPGVIGLQIWRADLESTLVPVRDADLRGEPDRTSPLAVFVEATGPDPLTALAAGPLSAEALAARGGEDAVVSVHRLMSYAEKEPMPDI